MTASNVESLHFFESINESESGLVVVQYRAALGGNLGLPSAVKGWVEPRGARS